MNTVEPPLSPRSLLEIASFEFGAFGQKGIESTFWEQFVEAAKKNPGSILAEALTIHTDYDICQRIIRLAKSIFDLSIIEEKEKLHDEAIEFVKVIDPYLSNDKIPLSIYQLRGDLFQLLGNLHDLIGDHKRSEEAYLIASTCSIESGNQIHAAKLLVEKAKQILLIDPKKRQEAASLFEYAGDVLNDNGSDWMSVINCYQQALELYEGDYAKAAEILEKIGDVYKPMPDFQGLASQSFARASTYYGFLDNVKKQAESLEKAAIYA